MNDVTVGIAGNLPKRGRAQARPRGVLLALLLAATPALASDVAVSVKHKNEIYEVRGRFVTRASIGVAWAVLSDYDNIPRFVDSMKESRVETRDSTRLKLRQAATVGVFPARKTVRITLDVEEQVPHRIRFHDVSGQDFRQYIGSWALAADSAGTTVTYTLDARPRSALVHVFGRNVMSRESSDLLKQVKAEIERRASVR